MSELRTIARPYAKAVFEIAKAENSFAQWQQVLTLASEIVAHPGVRGLIKHPSFSDEAILQLFFDLGQDVFGEKAKSFLTALSMFSRYEMLPEILEIFEELRAAQESQVKVDFVCARELPESVITRFKEQLKTKLKTHVVLSTQVDPSLIGGGLIRMGDKVLDGSIRGRLHRLKEAIER